MIVVHDILVASYLVVLMSATELLLLASYPVVLMSARLGTRLID